MGNGITSHDVETKKILDELKAIPNPTEQQKKIIEAAEREIASKDILTTHKVEYLARGLDPETGEPLQKHTVPAEDAKTLLTGQKTDEKSKKK